MSAVRFQHLGPLERQSIRLTIATLEKQAAASGKVVISDRLARAIAGWLKQLTQGVS